MWLGTRVRAGPDTVRPGARGTTCVRRAAAIVVAIYASRFTSRDYIQPDLRARVLAKRRGREQGERRVWLRVSIRTITYR